jgi:hypothetical protein
VRTAVQCKNNTPLVRPYSHIYGAEYGVNGANVARRPIVDALNAPYAKFIADSAMLYNYKKLGAKIALHYTVVSSVLNVAYVV